jgi:redox-sensitive bicupin YhaK (pirin superfamily)
VAGVERKYFGSFTERAFWIEMIKIDAGAEWLSTSEGTRRLIVALSGTASVDGVRIGRLAAIQVDAGEKLHISATEEMVLYIVGLPPLQLPSTPTDQFDLIESDGAIQFENARQDI